MKGYEAIPHLIRRSGAGTVFGMLGGTNVQWISAGVQEHAIRFVRTRHEETSVAAATAYARTTGRIGVCTVTRGPGFANSINALIAAIFDHVPVLLVVAESPATRIETTQNIDQQAIARAIGAGFHHVSSPESLEETFWTAIAALRWNGLPQILSLADGVNDGDVELGGVPEIRSGATGGADVQQIRLATELLAASRRPLILAGQGAQLAGTRRALEELADLSGAQVACTLNVNRFFSGYPRDLGVVGDSTPPLVWKQLDEVDLIFSVGASLNKYTTSRGRLYDGARVIQCEVDEAVTTPELPGTVRLGGDARMTVDAVLAYWKEHRLSRGFPAADPLPLTEISASVMEIALKSDRERGLDLREIYRVFNDKLPPDRIVITDSGRRKATMPTLMDAPDGRSWLVTRGHGSIGLGLGAAVGAAAAFPDRRVVLFCGDGGFMMAAEDLDAFRLNGLSVIIVIANDRQYGSERRYLKMYDLPAGVIQQDMPDIPLLAQAFGGQGVTVRTLAELEAVRLPEGGIFIVDARVDPEVDWAAIYK